MTRTTIAALLLAGSASGQAISVTFENLLPSGGTAFTPVFFGLPLNMGHLIRLGRVIVDDLARLCELRIRNQARQQHSPRA
mgnify:CR=1 FL=1